MRASIAEQVAVVSDGEIALHGALAGGPGILVIAGTGSVAYGRSEAGRVERTGGWGMILGDEGGGYEIARGGLRAALKAIDGRGPETRLVSLLLDVIGLSSPDAIPSWTARAEKAEVAMLAVHVIRAAEREDPVARMIVCQAGRDLAAHVEALALRLGPWSTPPAVVAHGGVATDPIFVPYLAAAISRLDTPVSITESRADAVTGALNFARSLEKARATV